MASDSQIAGKGRPTEYTKEIGETICDRIVDGESLRTICADAGMPDPATVSGWFSSHPKFRYAYELARALQAEGLMDESLDIIDDTSGYPGRAGSGEWKGGTGPGSQATPPLPIEGRCPHVGSGAVGAFGFSGAS